MRGWLKYAALTIVLLIVLEACTGVPGATAPSATQVPTTSALAATESPAATAAPGSTEAAPEPGTGSDGAATGTPSAGAASPTPSSTAEVAPTVAASATALDATATAPIETTVPEPTMPPAATAPPAAQAAAAIACTPGALTPEQTEGPYYQTNPPEASDLLQPGMNGTKLTVSGYVLDAQCKPVPGARIDFWQADSEGQYDNQGYTLRGYQVTDAQGRYSVKTVVPGLYPGRTRHIHVKVTPPTGPTLTTQLYFPNEQANASDQIFSPDLIMKVEKLGDGETGTFNFVVQTR